MQLGFQGPETKPTNPGLGACIRCPFLAVAIAFLFDERISHAPNTDTEKRHNIRFVLSVTICTITHRARPSCIADDQLAMSQETPLIPYSSAGVDKSSVCMHS